MKHIQYISIILSMFFMNYAQAFEIQSIEPNEIKQIINQHSKVKLIYIFTSWCSICKNTFPQMMALQQKFAKDNVEVIMLSLDEEPDLIEKIFQVYKEKNFNIYRVHHSQPHEIMKGLLEAGINYRGSIPHLTLIDSDGKVIINGSFRISDMEKGIEYLLKR